MLSIFVFSLIVRNDNNKFVDFCLWRFEKKKCLFSFVVVVILTKFTDLFIVLCTARMDRYNHDLGGEDTDDTDDFPLIGSFGSYSPQYRKHNSSLVQINLPQQSLDESINTSSGSGTASPISTNLNQSANASLDKSTLNIGKIMATPQLRKLDVSRPTTRMLNVKNWQNNFENVSRELFVLFSIRQLGLSYKCYETAVYTRHRLYSVVRK